MKTKSKLWIAGFMILVVGTLCTVGYLTIRIDPFFHFHKPDTSQYYYPLNNQRSQNDGIARNFDYDALITGTSMTENFKTSEMDALFGVNSIKIPYSGGSYKEINDSISRALAYNPNLKIVVRGLDMNYFFDDEDLMRQDLGEYPSYLYDQDRYNDVEYIFNRGVVFNRIYKMITERKGKNFTPGITTFDDYSNWMNDYTFGIKSVCPDGIAETAPGEPVHITETERQSAIELVEQNVTSLAKAHPDVEFYYFFPPYSAVWWKGLLDDGRIYRQIEAERIYIESILDCENIRLYSFNNLTEITTDLNNYKDNAHYGEWINSLILRCMKEDQCRLTPENYRDYLDDELSFYTSYDYSQLADEVDYENDDYAGVRLNERINGVAPPDIPASLEGKVESGCANAIADQHDGTY